MLTDYTARKKQRIMQDDTAYSSYVKSPYSLGSLAVGSLSTSFILPANGIVGVSCSINTIDDKYSVYINGIEKILTGSSANVIKNLGYLYKPWTIQVKPKSGLTTCTINIYHYDYWNRPYIIASGSLA